MDKLSNIKVELQKSLKKYAKSEPAVVELVFLLFNPPIGSADIYDKEKIYTKLEHLKHAKEVMGRLDYSASEIDRALLLGSELMGELTKPRLLRIFEDYHAESDIGIRHLELLNEFNSIFDNKILLKTILDRRWNRVTEGDISFEDKALMIKVLDAVDLVYGINSIDVRDASSKLLIDFGLLHKKRSTSSTGKTAWYNSSIIPRLINFKRSNMKINFIEELIAFLQNSKTVQDKSDPDLIKISEIMDDLYLWNRREISFEKLSGLNRWSDDTMSISKFIWKHRHRFKYLRNQLSIIDLPANESDFNDIKKSWIYHKIYRNFSVSQITVVSIATIIVSQNINAINFILFGLMVTILIYKIVRTR